MAKVDTEDPLAIVRATFQAWDADGGGTIERDELAAVMKKLSPQWGAREIDTLMSQIDTDGDGHISFDEFANWLTNPQAKKTLHEDGWFGEFDLKSVLKPLWDVFDRNGDGHLVMDEFADSFSIVVNCLKIDPSARDEPLSIGEHFESIFKVADQDGSGEIDFEEFVKWQSEAIRASRIPNRMLPKAVEELAAALSEINHIEQLSREGHEAPGQGEALMQLVKNVAGMARKLYLNKDKQRQLEEAKKKKEMKKKVARIHQWHNPPPDSNSLNHLRRRLKADLGIGGGQKSRRSSLKSGRSRESLNRGRSKSLSGAAESTAAGHITVVIPDLFEPGDVPSRWFAQAQGHKPDGTHVSLLYELANGSGTAWKILEEEGDFIQALEALPRPLKVYAVLVAHAMETKLSYADMSSALETAVQMGYLESRNVTLLNSQLHAMIEQTLDDDLMEELHASGELSSVVKEELEKEICATPLEVLGLLQETGMVVREEIWPQLASQITGG